MSVVMAQTDDYRSVYRNAAASLPGHGAQWVREAREAGLARFAELGFPTARNEDWKYTDVGVIARRQFVPALAAAAPVDPEALRPFLFAELDSHRMVFVDGHFAPALSSLDRLPDGLTVTSLAHALEERPEVLRARLGDDGHACRDGFAALNTAFMTDGAYIHAARGVVVDEPVHVLHLATCGDGVAAYLRNVVVVEDSAELTFIEGYAAARDAAYLVNVQTGIELGPNAGVEHYKLQQEGTKAFHLSGTRVHQHADSRYTAYVISSGARTGRNEIRAVLDGEGSECTLNGLSVLGGRQHVDNHTVIDHAKPHGTSREHYKSILDGHARSVFSGKVIVHEDAQQTDAQQTNHNLLLSDDAEADTRPQLEIYADDVKCAHGATVGQLDKDALYYLRSRAIDEEAARSLLIYAFANDILGRLKVEPMRARLEELLTARLLHGRKVEELT